ncbi:MAG: ketoacyl-ACP synthase III [Caldilineaceae bacterium]
MSEQSSSPTIRLHSIGVYLPVDRESNLARAEEFSVTRLFLEEKLGVLERAVKKQEETTSDLCLKAFQDLRMNNAVDVEQIQLLAVVTQNPDMKIPYTAAIVHQKLGLSKHCMTFDIGQGCAGYTHALTIFIALMEKLQLEHALLFTCDPYSEIVDRRDKNTALLFGDAASVSYLTTVGPGYRLLDTDFGTAPHSYTCLQCQDVLTMDGREVFTHAVREAPQSIHRLLARNELTVADIDLFLLHQGSKTVVDYLRQSLDIAPEKAPFAMQMYGNTISSSIPLLFKQPVCQQQHRKVLLSGFGVGFSWGSCLVELTQ